MDEEIRITSPLIKQKAKKEVDFPDAIRAVISGERITKLEWHDENVYGLLKDGFLQIHNADGSFHSWVINDGDLLGVDWVILQEN